MQPTFLTHPLAAIFPPMPPVEVEGLSRDILARGLLDPILLYEGKVLDGRHRLLACEMAGVAPRFEEYSGTDPLGVVLARNLLRRHLDDSQRAMVAARLATMRSEAGRPIKGVSVHRCTLVQPNSTESATPPRAPSQPAAAAALGVSVRSVKSARHVVDFAEPEVIAAVDAGILPVKVAAKLADEAPEAQRAALNHRAQGTGENEWFTPACYIEAARECMGGIDLDVASHRIAQETVKAARYFTIEDDGLSRDWSGRVWMNPPYAQPAIRLFCEKLVAEYKAKRVTEAIVLTHNYTDTAWFHALAAVASSICFTRGRIAFLSPGGVKAAPTQGQAFFYLGMNAEWFNLCFKAFGFTCSMKT